MIEEMQKRIFDLNKFHIGLVTEKKRPQNTQYIFLTQSSEYYNRTINTNLKYYLKDTTDKTYICYQPFDGKYPHILVDGLDADFVTHKLTDTKTYAAFVETHKDELQDVLPDIRTITGKGMEELIEAINNILAINKMQEKLEEINKKLSENEEPTNN